MEILAHGKSFAVTTCEHCSCRFGYSAREVFEFTSPNGEKKEIWVSCPECGKAVIVRTESK